MPTELEPKALPQFRSLVKYDLALIVAVGVLYNEVIFGSARIIGRDVLHYLIPIGQALGEAFAGRGSVLWESGVDHGLPVIARWSPMVFYPGQWLHAVFNPATAITIAILIHLAIAACALMRLALRYTPSIPAAWVAAFCFGCGGYVLSLSVGGGYLFGATLLPLSLLAFHRLAEEPTLTRMGQLAGVLVLQIFCADPQTLLYEGAFLAPFVLAFHRRAHSRLLLRFGMAALAGVIAVGITTCQWLPSIEFSRFSVRAGGLSFEAQDVWAFHPYRLAQFFSPHVFGAVTPQNTFWARSLVNADLNIPWAPHVYNGLLPWAGILVLEWRRRPSRAIGVVAGLTLFFLLLAFGASTPLFHTVLTVLPGARFFRYPEKFLVFVSLGICLLGAIGLGRLLEDLSFDRPGARQRRWRVILAFGALGATALGLRLWLDPSSPSRLEWFGGVILRQGTQLRPGPSLAMTASSLVQTAVIAGVIVAICLLARHLRPRQLILVGAMIAAADVLSASLTQRYLGDGASYAGTPASCGAISPDTSPVPPLVWRYDPSMYFQEPNVPHDGSRFERQRKWEWETLMANTGVAHCVRHAEGYEAARLKSHILLWQSMWENVDRRLALFGVRHVIAARASLDPAHFPVDFISDELNAVIHRVPDPLPYAHPLGLAEQVPDVDGAIKRLVDQSFDFHRTVVLERTTPTARFPEADRRATVRDYRQGDLTIEVEFGAPGYLLLQESYYPGWRAELDGRHPVTVERANATFIGVELPAGSHKVHFVFDPPLQRRANAVSLVFAGLFGLLLSGAGWFARRRAPRVA